MSVIQIQEILKYINEARTDPKKFSLYIKKELDFFINQKSLPLKTNCTYSTNEGKSCWKEAYQYMQNFKPTFPLQLNEGLNLAAMDHAMDMKANNFFDHRSSNGLSFGQRIQRRCGQSYGSMAENLGSDFDVNGRNHALQTILGLIIDDGVPNRGHRTTLLSPNYKYCGIFCIKQNDKYETVIDYHSQNIKTINNSKEPLLSKPNTKPNQQKNNFGMNFGDMKFQDGGKFNGGWQMSTKMTNNQPTQKYAKSTSTSTKTSTINGKTKKITTVKITYSDGSVQETTKEEIF